MKRIPMWQYGKSVLVVFSFIVGLGLSACNGGTTETASNAPPPSDGSGGTPPPVNPPPPPVVPPPPPGAKALVVDVNFCTNIRNPPREVNMKPSLGWWKDNAGNGSYDSFIVVANNRVDDGWTCYPVRMEHPSQPEWVFEGNLYIAIFLGDDGGAYPEFANTGMKKYRVSINGQDNPCIVLGKQYKGEYQAIVERTGRLAHIFAETHPDGSLSWSERFLPCNDGDQCPVDCKDDMEDDGYQGE